MAGKSVSAGADGPKGACYTDKSGPYLSGTESGAVEAVGGGACSGSCPIDPGRGAMHPLPPSLGPVRGPVTISST